MKKQYLLLLALAAGLANSLVAMEDPNGPQKGQKRKRDDIVKSQADESKEQKVDEEDKPLGDLSVLPNEILTKILSETGLELKDLIKISQTNKAFRDFLQNIIRDQVLKDLEAYKAHHHAEMKILRHLIDETDTSQIAINALLHNVGLESKLHFDDLWYNTCIDNQPNAFHIAVARKDEEFISRYLPLVHSFGIDINQITANLFQTPLDFAIYEAAGPNYNDTLLRICDLFMRYDCIRTAVSLFHTPDLIAIALTFDECAGLRAEQMVKKLLSLLPCDELMTLYNSDFDFFAEDRKNEIKAFIRENHTCNNCVFEQ